MLTLNPQSAKSADNLATGIRETGKYIGEITRAEKLLSGNGTAGLGISFKSDSGQTADYLDLYITNAQGDELPSVKIVNAILAVLKLSECKDGPITFEKWVPADKKRSQTTVNGYPGLMGKKIGLLLQKELYNDLKDGTEKDRMIIVGVFQAGTDLTASEVLDSKTIPEKLPKMIEALMARPVRDSRKNGGPRPGKTASSGGSASMDYYKNSAPPTDDDIPFIFNNIGYSTDSVSRQLTRSKHGRNSDDQF